MGRFVVLVHVQPVVVEEHYIDEHVQRVGYFEKELVLLGLFLFAEVRLPTLLDCPALYSNGEKILQVDQEQLQNDEAGKLAVLSGHD